MESATSRNIITPYCIYSTNGSRKYEEWILWTSFWRKWRSTKGIKGIWRYGWWFSLKQRWSKPYRMGNTSGIYRTRICSCSRCRTSDWLMCYGMSWLRCSWKDSWTSRKSQSGCNAPARISWSKWDTTSKSSFFKRISLYRGKIISLWYQKIPIVGDFLLKTYKTTGQLICLTLQ